MPSGPCVMCGATDYRLSMGGPGICPSCDCGISPEVSRLKRENAELRARLAKLEEMRKLTSAIFGGWS